MTVQNKRRQGDIVFGFTELAENVTRDPLTFLNASFTRSNGSVMARCYERLTKASRRRYYADTWDHPHQEKYEEGYRRGVYDAYKALQLELTNRGTDDRLEN